MSENDVAKLNEKIAELEQQFSEEREEFEWDLKAVKESTATTISKLEQEVAQLKKSAGGDGADEDLTRRALMAERKVAELQHELSRAKDKALRQAPVKDDNVLRLRAEAAEQEREELRKKKRELQRSLEDKQTSLKRLETEAREAKDLKREVDELRRKVSTQEKEIKRSQDSAADQTDVQGQEHTRLQADLVESKEALQHSQSKVRELADRLDGLVDLEAERDALKGQRDNLRERLDSLEKDLAAKEASQQKGQDERGDLAQRVEDLTAVESDRDGLKSQVDDLRKELLDRKSSLEHERARAMELADQLDRVSGLQAERDELAKKVESLERERTAPDSASAGDASGQDTARAEMEAERERLKEELEQVKAKSEAHQRTLADMMNASDEIAAEASDLKQQVTRLKAELEKERAEKEEALAAEPAQPEPLEDKGPDPELLAARKEIERKDNELRIANQERDEAVQLLRTMRDQREAAAAAPVTGPEASAPTDLDPTPPFRGKPPVEPEQAPDEQEPEGLSPSKPEPGPEGAPDSWPEPVATEVDQANAEQAQAATPKEDLLQTVKEPLPVEPLPMVSADQVEEEELEELQELEPIPLDKSGQGAAQQGESPPIREVPSTKDASGPPPIRPAGDPPPSSGPDGQDEDDDDDDAAVVTSPVDRGPRDAPRSRPALDDRKVKPGDPPPITLPHSKAPPRSGRGKGLSVFIVLVLATGLVLGAWYIFPIWFGVSTETTDGVEPGSVDSPPSDKPPIANDPVEPVEKPGTDAAADPDSEPPTVAASDERPTVDEGPDPLEKPVVDKEPGPDKKPLADKKPGPGKKPLADKKPGPGKKPLADKKPGPGKKPLVDKKPGPGKKPLADKKPGPGKKVAATKKPRTTRPKRDRAAGIKHLQQGNTLVKAKNYPAAITELHKALKADPSLVKAHRSLGIAYAQMKKPRKACNAYRRYLKAVPPNSPEVPALKKIVAGCK